jgi:cytochrome c553
MKITICIASVLAVSLTTLPSLHAQAANSQVERGQYLVAIMGCHDCHSPKLPGTMKPDPASLLSGRPQATKLPSTTPGEMHASEDFTAFTGGWGSTVASNLTPDQATGLGMRYTEEKFVKAMREGKKPEGIAMMPPMPVDVYANVKDEDLKAIFAYLKTVKPVRNAVRAGLTPEKK